MRHYLLLPFCCLLLRLEAVVALAKPFMKRKTFIGAALTTTLGSSGMLLDSAQALAFQQTNSAAAATPTRTTVPTTGFTGSDNDESQLQQRQATVVGYKPLSLSMDEFSVNVPVACWFPVAPDQEEEEAMSSSPLRPATYDHRISVRKIGQLLAKWDTIPGFVARDYSLQPTSRQHRVVDASNLLLPNKSNAAAAPVVILAHGYLGSRFDLSHLAEELAAQGFVCLAAEYPESLAASYDNTSDGLDRARINQVLLDTMQNQWNIPASSYGIVGHSLGCGTAMQTGDESWTRVLISGFPRQREGSQSDYKMLLLTSMNDGLMGRYLADKSNIPADFTLLDESTLLRSLAATTMLTTTPTTVFSAGRSMLLFDRPDAPNHISFLAENVNNAMIEFLSPLLPVARLLDIPVLDF